MRENTESIAEFTVCGYILSDLASGEYHCGVVYALRQWFPVVLAHDSKDKLDAFPEPKLANIADLQALDAARSDALLSLSMYFVCFEIIMGPVPVFVNQ